MSGRIFSNKRDFGAVSLLFASVVFLAGSIGFRMNTLVKLDPDAHNASPSVARVGTIEANTQATSVAAPPAPVGTVTPELSAGLATQLNAWAKKQPTSQRWGIVVRSLDDSSLNASYRPDTTFEAASVYKLYLVYGLDKLMPFPKWQTTHIDDTHTYADCVQAMMAKSDNQCATEIGDKLGWTKLSAMLAPAGYIHTSLKADPTTTTPIDTAQLLTDLYNRKGFSDDSATFILKGMSQSAFRKGIVAGCPDCQVANKTGDLNGFVHDAGVVTIGGHHYILAIFSKGGSQTQIAAVSGVVHDYIVANQ